MNRIIPATTVLLACILATSNASAGARFIGETDNSTRHWFDDGATAPPWTNPINMHFDSTRENSIDQFNQYATVEAAGQTWETVPCSNIDFERIVDVPAVDYGTFNPDGMTVITYADPGDVLALGVLAATTTPYTGVQTETVNNVLWRRVLEFDMVWNTGVDFGSPAEIDDPGCSQQYDMQAIALHEMGHGIGYAHPCDIGESCPDPDKVGAIMAPTISACTNKRDPAAYDLESHSISYGTGTVTTFNASIQSGPTPLDVSFTPLTLSSSTISSASWNFGDGLGSTLVAPTHSYVAEGRYTVTLSLTATSTLPACSGSFTHVVRKSDYIVACNVLNPSFEVVSVSGKSVKFKSTTDGAAAGCLQILEWDFGDGETSNVQQPIHQYAQGGTYSVTLTATGPGSPAGVTSAASNVKTGGGGGGVCNVGLDSGLNAAAAAGALLAAVAMSLATVARRRRERA